MTNLNDTAEQKRLNEARERNVPWKKWVVTCLNASGVRFGRITATMATRGATSATIKLDHALTTGVRMA